MIIDHSLHEEERFHCKCSYFMAREHVSFFIFPGFTHALGNFSSSNWLAFLKNVEYFDHCFCGFWHYSSVGDSRRICSHPMICITIKSSYTTNRPEKWLQLGIKLTIFWEKTAEQLNILHPLPFIPGLTNWMPRHSNALFKLRTKKTL